MLNVVVFFFQPVLKLTSIRLKRVCTPLMCQARRFRKALQIDRAMGAFFMWECVCESKAGRQRSSSCNLNKTWQQERALTRTKFLQVFSKLQNKICLLMLSLSLWEARENSHGQIRYNEFPNHGKCFSQSLRTKQQKNLRWEFSPIRVLCCLIRCRLGQKS